MITVLDKYDCVVSWCQIFGCTKACYSYWIELGGLRIINMEKGRKIDSINSGTYYDCMFALS